MLNLAAADCSSVATRLLKYGISAHWLWCLLSPCYIGVGQPTPSCEGCVYYTGYALMSISSGIIDVSRECLADFGMSLTAGV